MSMEYVLAIPPLLALLFFIGGQIARDRYDAKFKKRFGRNPPK